MRTLGATARLFFWTGALAIAGLLFSGAAVADGWLSEGGTTQDTPSIVSTQQGKATAIFVRGPGDSLWWSPSFSGKLWTNLGGKIDAAPSCFSVSTPNRDVVECFARGPDLALWRIRLTNGNVDLPWTSLGGQIVNSPSAISWSKGRAAVFALGIDGKLWSLIGEAPTILGGDYRWGSWQPTKLEADSKFKGSPACSSDSANSDVVCLIANADGWTYTCPFACAGWYGVKLITEVTKASPYTPALNDFGQIVYVANGSGALKMVTQGMNASNETPTELGGIAKSGVTCTSMASAPKQKQYRCVVKGADGAVWLRSFFRAN